MALGNFGVKTISSYINEGPYAIPEYQRDYSWEAKNESLELWNDIMAVKKDGINDFFLGQLVVHMDNTENKKYIIDGQQRTITLFLLLLAIKSSFSNIEENTLLDSAKKDAKKFVTKIQSLLGIIDKDDKEEKLVLGENDGKYFIDNILYKSYAELTNPKNKSRKNMVGTYREFYDRINDELLLKCASDDEKITELKNLYDIVITNLKLLYVETTDESEAFMIFETLNARGRDLETSDLLKNYLFKVSKINIDAVKKDWQKLNDCFTECGNASLTNYIRSIWNSQEEFVREKILYKKITSEVRTPKDAVEFVSRLMNGKELYLAMLSPDSQHCLSSDKNHEALESVFQELSDLSVKTYFPVILAFYFRFINSDELVKDLIRVAKAVEIIIVRDIVICEHSPASYEKFFSELALKITNMEVNTADEIIDAIKKESVEDIEFQTSFEIYTCASTPQGKKKIRYLLRKMINSQAGEMEIKRNNDEIHIEHIMPQTKGKWNVSNDDHEKYLWRLGNLTLLNYEINEDIKNSLYDVKSKEYSKSTIIMTKELGNNYPKWDKDEIIKRQKDLYEIAKGIWLF